MHPAMDATPRPAATQMMYLRLLPSKCVTTLASVVLVDAIASTKRAKNGSQIGYASTSSCSDNRMHDMTFVVSMCCRHLWLVIHLHT